MESSSLTLQETEDGYQPVFFEPRPLRNLQLVQETSSLMPITDMKVGQRNISLLIYFLKSITLTDAHTPVEEQGAERRRRDRLDREVTETVLRV